MSYKMSTIICLIACIQKILKVTHRRVTNLGKLESLLLRDKENFSASKFLLHSSSSWPKTNGSPLNFSEQFLESS